MTGLPYFAKKVCELLRRRSPSGYLFLDISRSNIWAPFLAFYALLVARVIYRVSGVPYPHPLFQWALRLRIRVVMHWVGDDVLRAQEWHKAGRLDKEWLSRIEHWVETDWLRNELARCGIVARVMPLMPAPAIASPPPFPRRFTVLAYIAPGYEKPFRIGWILSLAHRFPEISIRIAGLTKPPPGVRPPPNVIFLGWVPSLVEEMKRCTAYVRVPVHDGLAVSVLEALACGRWVAYTYDVPGSEQVTMRESLCRAIGRWLDEHKRKKLKPNFAGIQYVKKRYSQESVLETLDGSFRAGDGGSNESNGG